MRISDWSSDVCSSDLERQEVAACSASPDFRQQRFKVVHVISKIGCGPWATAMLAGPPSSGRFRLEREHVDMNLVRRWFSENLDGALFPGGIAGASPHPQDRRCVVWGKMGAVRVDLGGVGIIKKKK